MSAGHIPNSTTAGLESVFVAATEAMTDNMVERLTQTSSNALEVLDRLNDDDTREAILGAIDALTTLHQSGALNTVVELLLVMQSARNAMTDSMIERLVGFAEHLMNTFATEEIVNLAHETITALEDTVNECNHVPPPTGALGAVKMMTRPESLQTLQFLVTFGMRFRERAAMLAKTTHDTP